ncbi:glutamine-hydrolyzing GMP synthase [Mycoplasma suis]|uniref:GMP synthase (glutamine-hydrolyzing) n=2 Tax=Mycoplasma suis TaxID=57372 RepID=F0QR95_MYCSL|nr:glutamine-hydrolyzing GMP synthase [Mycoplasma suis]ADX98015.1 GMP synthase [Mycoplasma suis str. Illinois]CBZ40511.1 GMP synthase (Glutamine-hydrolyzing) [Mycoplasma suis KI3806]
MSVNLSSKRENKVLFIDLGSQYSCVLERKLKSLGCNITKYFFEEEKVPPEEFTFSNFGVVFLSGSPASVSEVDDKAGYSWLKNEIISSKQVPIMGICFGMQLIHHFFGGKIEQVDPLFGESQIERERNHPLFLNIPQKFKIWGSFNESVTKLGHGFYSLANRGKISMISSHVTRSIYTIQFHPELNETEFGDQLFRNFLVEISNVELEENNKEIDNSREINSKIEALREKYKEQLKDARILVALSGGLDSSVLIHFLAEMTIDRNIYPVYISTGLVPKEKEEKVIKYFANKFSNFRVVSWEDSIFNDLKSVTSPEEKRKIIAQKFKKTFDEIYEQEVKRNITHLAQGTIYSDVIESGKLSSKYSKIKTHHNVEMVKNESSLPYKVVEPLSDLFKDQVRMLGARLNLPAFLLSQQPFPGPGLAIRVIGEVTKEKVELISSLHDFMEREFIERKIGKYSDQHFPILLPGQAVGVKGDQRVYGNAVVLRAVKTIDFMSANVSQIPLSELVSLANKMVSKFPQVSRVLFDLTTKPGGTIEWE